MKKKQLSEEELSEKELTEAKRIENDKHNKAKTYKESWLYRMFKDYDLSVREKQMILRELVRDYKEKKKLETAALNDNI